jgi:hypothetical protein
METETKKMKPLKKKKLQEMPVAPPRDASARSPSIAQKVARNFWKLVDHRGEDDEILHHEGRAT